VTRRSRPSAVSIALCACALALCLLAPGQATGEVAVQPPSGRPATGLQVHLSGAALVSAARRCAQWAADAGFANDGYLAGGLVTAVAVALAESGCSPSACFDDTRSRSCSQFHLRRSDSVDRGAWQLNSRAHRSISNRCAFSGPCSAVAAYNAVAAVGTFFARWTQYSTDAYAHYLWPAQRAVSGLRYGTVTSALAGSCLGYPQDGRGVAARLENCGTRAGQAWHLIGTALHTPRGLCLSATSRRPGAVVRLARCSHRSRLQLWRQTRLHQLYNPGAHRCLSDPTGGDKPGLILTTSACRTVRPQTWFRP